MSEDIKLDITLQEGAEDNGAKTVSITGVAYSGGVVSQYFGNVVVNLDGMKFAKQIPLMNSHSNSVEDKLGEVECEVKNGKLFISGKIVSESEIAKKIIAEGKLSNWQLSIGAAVNARRFVEEGTSVEVNGKTFKGPVFVAEKTLLREVSVVAIGADADTNMKISASWDFSKFNCSETQIEGGNNMAENKEANPAKEPEVQATKTNDVQMNNGITEIQMNNAISKATEDAIVAERKRVSDIKAICNGEDAEIEAKAVAEGWTLDKTRQEMLNSIRAKRPATSFNVHVPSAPSRDAVTLEASTLMRLGFSGDELIKNHKFSEKSVESADKMRLSLKNLMLECLRLSGQNVDYCQFDNDTIRAAFSTVSLPTILGNSANKVMLRAFNAYVPVALKLCREGNLNDFKESDRVRLNDLGDFEIVANDGEVKHGALGEDVAKNKLETYGRSFCLTRQNIINDDLGVFNSIPTSIGNKAAKLIDKLFFARLLANPTQGDGNALFSAAHNNLTTSAAFGKETLQNAIAKFESQTDADGTPCGISPAIILVGSALKIPARELVHGATLIATGDTDTVRPALNGIAEENLTVVSSAYLNGSTDWYLFGNPAMVDTFEIGYLNGKKTPTIERGETDFNTLGMWFRGYYDLGIREQDFRGMSKQTA